MANPPTTISRADLVHSDSSDFFSFNRAQQRISCSGITYSEAHGEMYKERLRGCLYKKGFRFRRAWVPRYVVLAGRMLRYFARPTRDDDLANERGSIELTGETVVSFEQFSLSTTGTGNAVLPDKFGFIVFVRGISAEGQTSCCDADLNRWEFRARSEREREMWMREINRVVHLIRRGDMVPTLMGMGKITTHFVLQREIGKGKYGTVAIAHSLANGRPYAVRIVHRAKILASPHARHFTPAWEREARLIKKIYTNHLAHRNVTYLYFVFEEPFTLFFVKDLCAHGSLEDRIPMSETAAASAVEQIANALAMLHANGVVVVDLQPRKILFQNALTLKINDFSSAHHVSSEFATLSDAAVLEQQQLLPPGYIAPELITHKQVSKQCDLWTLGVLLAHCVTGRRPYQRHEDVRRGLPPRIPASAAAALSPACQSLVNALIVPNRTLRLQSARDVLANAFVKRRLFKLSTVARSILAWVRLAKRWIIRASPAAAAPAAPAEMPMLKDGVKAGATTSTRLGTIVKAKSYTEIRNEQWTMDALAKRARDERLGSSEHFLTRRGGGGSGGSRQTVSASFTAIGISASIAGQLSEYGELEPVVSKPGPFMTALEDFLEDEASGFETELTAAGSSSSNGSNDSSSSEEEEEYAETFQALTHRAPRIIRTTTVAQ